MAIEQLFANDSYKVLQVSFKKKQSLPLHKATSDAFIMVHKGNATLFFATRQVQLTQGLTQLIPADEAHRLEINDDFSACLVLAAKADIRFI